MSNASYIGPVSLDGQIAVIVPLVDANNTLAAPTGTPSYSIYSLNGDNAGSVMASGTGTLAALPTPVTGLMLLTHDVTSANQYEAGGSYQIIGTYVVSAVTKPFNYVFTVS